MCSEPARMPAKYYIYAGGRWCEVDTRRGRVSGWRQRARFCFLRGGRLEVARTARVLRALRALATGVGSAARDAAPLQRRRPHRPRPESARAHHCCSQHLHHSRCDLNANELTRKPPNLSASTPITVSSPRKRKRSMEDDASIGKQPRSDTEAKTVRQGTSQSKTGVRVGGKEEQIVQSLLESSLDERREAQEKSMKSPQKSKSKIRSQEEEELVQSLLQSSSEDCSNKNLKSKGIGVKVPNSQKNLSQLKAEEEVVRSLLSFPVTEKIKSPQKSPQNIRARGKAEQKIDQSLLETSSSEDSAGDTQPRQPPKSKYTESDSTSASTQRELRCKELVIGDDDVAILRKFLERGADGTDLERFDNDVEYKTSVFYKLNPLVVLKRCLPLERLLQQQLSLEQFARQLGLRSVANLTPEKRYRMRHSTRRARRVSIDSETDKESIAKPKRRQLWNRDKELFNSRCSRSSDIRERPQIPKPAIDRSPDNDSDSEVKRHIPNPSKRTSTRLNPVKEKESKIANDDDSVVSDSDSDSEKSDGGKSDKDKDSVVVTDNSDSDKSVDDTRKTRARVKSYNESDESKSDEGKSVVARTRSSTTKIDKNNDESESVIVSDSDDRKSVRRTRSQGPEKEHNKSVVISDTDSNADENRDVTKKKVSSDDSEDQEPRRTRSRGPDRALKEHRSVNSDKELTKVDRNVKSKKDVERTEVRTTRSSMRGTDSESKEKSKTDSWKEKATTSKETIREQDKARNNVKGTKILQVISDSYSSRARTAKGRFVKTKDRDKEKNKETQRTEVNKEKEPIETRKGDERQRIEKSTDIEKNRTGNDSGKSRAAAAVSNMLLKPIKFKKSCVANGREYTSLEDHAIVAWVSLGNRERKVNGNAIWRELEEEYPRLTSQTRSWHSLRNRYLRYILPALGSLALPPGQVSRLRAAAAIGIFKRRDANRRNSIFIEPRVRSAAAAGRARLRIDSEDEDRRERTPPSPRRPRPLSPPSSSVSPVKRPSPAETSNRVASSKTVTSPSKTAPSPSKTAPSPSKTTRSASKTVPSRSKIVPSFKTITPPSKTAPSPSKTARSPSKTTRSPAKTSRSRTRPSASSTPQKKRRIHHL